MVQFIIQSPLFMRGVRPSVWESNSNLSLVDYGIQKCIPATTKTRCPLFILPFSRCGCAPAFYTAHFLFRQHPRILYLAILASAAPPLFTLPGSRCGSAPAFYTYQFSLRQHPPLSNLPISRCGSACAFYTY